MNTSRKAEITAEVDALIKARDAGQDTQEQIDALMVELEAIVQACPEFQRKQAAAAWGRACADNILWNN